MDEPTLKEKTAKGLFWGGLSNGVQQLLGVCVGIVLLIELTADEYGMVGMLTIFVVIASAIQESGFTAALINRKEFKEEDYNAVFWFNILVSTLMYVVLFFSAPLIASFFGEPDLIPLARVLFLCFLVGSLGIAHNAVLFKQLKVKERAKIDVFSTLVAGGVGIYMAVSGYSYWALAFQSLTHYTLGTVLRWYFSPWRPSFSFNFRPVKEMFGFSFKLLIAVIIGHIQANIFSVLLGKYNSKADVGFYSQGMKWSAMGQQVINGMVSSVTQPVFVEIKEQTERVRQVFRKMLRFISFVSFPVLWGIAFVGPEFITLINTEWLPCVPVLQIYCIWGAFAPLSVLYMQVIISRGHSSFYFIYSVFYAVIQIAVAVMTFSYGIYWMAFAVITVSFLFLFVLHIFLSRDIRLRLWEVVKDVSPYLVITFGIFAIVYWVTRGIESVFLRFCAKVILSVIGYCLVMWKSNSVIFRETVDMLLDKWKGKA